LVQNRVIGLSVNNQKVRFDSNGGASKSCPVAAA
jgi:hypothetical protein